MGEKIYKKVCSVCGEEFCTENKFKRVCPGCRKTKKSEYEKNRREQYKKPEVVNKEPNVKKQAKKQSIAPDMRRCKNCFYGAMLDGNSPICDYITITGHSRPCLPGADCTVFEPKESGRKKKRKPIILGRESETEFDAYVQDSIFRTEKKRRR